MAIILDEELRAVRLDRNFYLGEFLDSRTAAAHNIDMTPSADVMVRLVTLTRVILQPLRNLANEQYRQDGEPEYVMALTSGYRPSDLNARVGGTVGSYHTVGLAADFTIPGLTLQQVVDLCRKIPMIDKCIIEFDSWIHVQHPKFGREPRHQFFALP